MVRLDDFGQLSITWRGARDGVVGGRCKCPTHRRQIGCRQRGHVPHAQSGDRGSAGRRRRRQRRGHEPRHRRRAAGLRRHRLVSRHRTSGALPASAARRDARACRGVARDHHRRGRRAADAHSQRPAGRPIDDLAFSADTAESYQWNQDLGEAAPLGIPTRRTIAREAVGVVGAITPWNFPHQINLAKLGRRWRRATRSC
ncbi:aldehyde dehydrogenase family protein [Mycobacterium xenopi 4042]|uniref:Aldehyde dehydrogenase family protein n=1 Tax=Mycobacterium xenopi 4042 TaxID=1299334 RepID=X8AGV2_MYCXE|nr:aldehyde dehydrogenase family protein [Mycobacterium xenopi 4042]